MRQLDGVKNTILRQANLAGAVDRQVLRLAVAEAEALAWQTPYPHLLFPTLAQEKAAAANRWTERQRVLKNSGPVLAFAA